MKGKEASETIDNADALDIQENNVNDDFNAGNTLITMQPDSEVVMESESKPVKPK